MNINDLRVVEIGPGRTPAAALVRYNEVSESELLGLAVQLLKQRGAVEKEVKQQFDTAWGSMTIKAGRYLVVPLSALEDTE